MIYAVGASFCEARSLFPNIVKQITFSSRIMLQ
jgi:hypothetical protein